MPLIPLDKVRAGMRTATPILDSGGTLLVREGVEISADLLTNLRNRKIVAVDVQPEQSLTPSPAAARRGDPEADVAALSHAFANVMGNEIMKSLYDSAVAHVRARHGGKA